MIHTLALSWAAFSYMSAIGMKQNRNSMLQFDSIPTMQMRLHGWLSFTST